ncbi:uncharacterized protein LOC132938864 [Metopolophium dirhodum]|uniref:uncharacterized protein LOC132938864 n=1 Tax=Metopolophium dirhodum TaxID=44670 RepID=UPI0029908131|nr:uncharacterized protein LOC132938864 [Metopolophium dirhodum]
MPPSKSVSFSQEEDTKLAELVSQHPCIFDVEHKLYKNQGVRDNVWQKISEYMNKSLDDCRKRWKNMKDTYNKHKRNRKSGSRSSVKSKPSKWALSRSLSFLDVVSSERDPQSTNVFIAEKEVENVVEDAEVQELNGTFLPSVPSTSGSHVDLSEQRDVSRPGKRKLITKKCPINNWEHNEEWIVLLKKGIEERKIIFETNKFEKDDPIDTFFKSMASTVKTFSPSLKIRVKREVFNIVNNLEFENNDNNDSTSRSNENSEYSSYSNLSTQSYLSGFTKYNIPTPVYISPEVTNNQIVENNCIMQFEENYDEETQL